MQPAGAQRDFSPILRWFFTAGSVKMPKPVAWKYRSRRGDYYEPGSRFFMASRLRRTLVQYNNGQLTAANIWAEKLTLIHQYKCATQRCCNMYQCPDNY